MPRNNAMFGVPSVISLREFPQSRELFLTLQIIRNRFMSDIDATEQEQELLPSILNSPATFVLAKPRMSRKASPWGPIRSSRTTTNLSCKLS